MAPTEIDQDAIAILEVLQAATRDEYVDRNEIAQKSGLPPNRVNDAIALLVNAGRAEWIQTFGTAPFDFNSARITSRGRYERQRVRFAMDGLRRAVAEVGRTASPSPPQSSIVPISVDLGIQIQPPAPVGSPFGFTDEDWEVVAARKNDPRRLYTVLGHQFESLFFDGPVLRDNVEAMLRRAVDLYNAERRRPTILLEHRALNAV